MKRCEPVGTLSLAHFWEDLSYLLKNISLPKEEIVISRMFA